VGGGIAGKTGGLQEGVPRQPDASILGEQLITGPSGLFRKDPAEGNTVIIGPDAKGETPVAQARFFDGNGRFVVPVVDRAVASYRQSIGVDPFPVSGTDPHSMGEEGGSAGRLFKDQIERSRIDEDRVFIGNTIDGKAVGGSESYPDLAVGRVELDGRREAFPGSLES